MRSAVGSIMAAALLAGCANGSPPGLPRSAQTDALATTPAAHSVAVDLVDEGWHTGLVLPVAALPPSHLGLRAWFPGAKYLVFGWGNRSFYMAAHPGPATALSALFPSPSVLYVRGLRRSPRKAFSHPGELRSICVTTGQERRLVLYLNAYFRKRRHGTSIELGSGPLPNSRFFASVGTYDAWHTCNTWTLAALAFAGLPVNAQGVVFAGQVMSQTRSLPACTHGVHD